MIHVIASIQVKEGQLNTFLEIFKANVSKVLEEKGCLAYAPTVDVPTGLPPQEMNPHGATIIEKWNSLEDLKAHLSSPHMLAYREKTKALVEKMSVKILKEA
jgi:quinol monooxygenase YgiN